MRRMGKGCVSQRLNILPNSLASSCDKRTRFADHFWVSKLHIEAEWLRLAEIKNFVPSGAPSRNGLLLTSPYHLHSMSLLSNRDKAHGVWPQAIETGCWFACWRSQGRRPDWYSYRN